MTDEDILEPAEAELADIDTEPEIIDDDVLIDPAADEVLLGYRLSTLDE